MSSLEDRIFNSTRPGYWAIQVRLQPATDLSQRYLCHAENERAAGAIAGRLMGPGVNVRGYDLSWIDEGRLEATATNAPPLGGHRPTPDPLEWAALIEMSEQSEAAQRSQRSAH